MNGLARDIAEQIAHDGPISVERYMQLCLAHPTLGYYPTRDPLGAAGDFVTSPEISQMFGELIGLWTVACARASGAARLVELGPGRGTLMADALRAARVAKDFFAAVEIDLVETSPALIERQRATLAASGRPVVWRARVEEVPHAPAIFIANEFFDALPVRQYVKAGGAWRERLVGLDARGRLTFGAAIESEPAIAFEAQEGAVLEVGAQAQRIMVEIAARIVRHGGAALIIDYGHARTQAGDTLQAMRAHAFVDPLARPGEADLTTHVDFGALARAARATGAATHGPIAQGAFLKRLGVDQRAATLMRGATEAQARDIESARERLTSARAPTDMGALFKCLAVTRAGAPVPPGFEEGDRV